MLINLPMHYSYAFVAQLLATFGAGGQAVIARPPFTAARYVRTVEDHEITLSSLTPPMVEPLLASGKRLPGVLSGLTVGGGGLGVAAVTAMLARHPNLGLYLTYGLTEAGPRVSTLAAHLAAPRHYASVGLPLPEVGVHLRPTTPGDRIGELVVETDTGMLTRVGRTDETPVPADRDGRRLIGTGDEFELDDEGYLFFRRRRRGFVMSRGEKISPQSVCEIAETIPGIRGAQAWLRETGTGEFEFTLDVYCATGSIDEHEVRRRLAKVLLRGEQPAHVLVHPSSHLGWRKSAVD